MALLYIHERELEEMMRTVKPGEKGHFRVESEGVVRFFVGKDSFYSTHDIPPAQLKSWRKAHPNPDSEEVTVPSGATLRLWGYEDPYEAEYMGNQQIRLGKDWDFPLSSPGRGDCFVALELPR